MNYDELKAGRELDALVARRITGWSESPLSNYPWQLSPPEGSTGHAEGRVYMVPYYSRDIAAAWEVVEKVPLTLIPMQDNSGWIAVADVVFQATLEESQKPGYYLGWYEISLSSSDVAFAPTAAHAICIAALKATEIQQ